MEKLKIITVFIICPVRVATPEQKQRLLDYTKSLETCNAIEGHCIAVHYPAIDTDQDVSGFEICSQNANAIYNSDEVHVFWDKNSRGTLFDMGVAFALEKPVYIINPEDIEPEELPGTSFINMLCDWSFRSEKFIRAGGVLNE